MMIGNCANAYPSAFLSERAGWATYSSSSGIRPSILRAGFAIYLSAPWTIIKEENLTVLAVR